MRDMVLTELELWMETTAVQGADDAAGDGAAQLTQRAAHAATLSPTASLSLSPTMAGVRPSVSILMTAMSLVESSPTTVAG